MNLKQYKRKHNKGCVVYGIYDSENRLKYIGQTRCTLDKRMNFFYKKINNKIRKNIKLSPIEDWLRTAKNIEIRVIVPNGTWDISEILEIDKAKKNGIDLLNVVRGGNDSVNDMTRKKHVPIKNVYRPPAFIEKPKKKTLEDSDIVLAILNEETVPIKIIPQGKRTLSSDWDKHKKKRKRQPYQQRY